MPLLLAAGVPLNFAVPLPLSMKVTPDGKLPDSEIAGAGDPVVVTLNDPAVPILKLALFGLVNAGPCPTFNVKLCDASVPTPLLAVSVRVNVPPVVGVPESFPVPS